MVNAIWEHSGGCSDNHSKHRSTRYGHNKKCLSVEEGGTYTVY